jgi:hypothetical protein
MSLSGRTVSEIVEAITSEQIENSKRQGPVDGRVAP